MQPARITREQYLDMVRQGYRFSNAGLYEPDHAPKAKFVLVEFAKSVTKFMRVWPPATRQ